MAKRPSITVKKEEILNLLMNDRDIVTREYIDRKLEELIQVTKEIYVQQIEKIKKKYGDNRIQDSQRTATNQLHTNADNSKQNGIETDKKRHEEPVRSHRNRLMLPGKPVGSSNPKRVRFTWNYPKPVKGDEGIKK